MPLDLRRWLGVPPPPDGSAPAVEAEALRSGRALAGDEAAKGAAVRHRALPRPDTVVQAALAQKVLHGWMQNRHQTRTPLVLNLRNTTPEEAALVLQAVREALWAADPGAAAFRRAQDWIAGKGGDLQPGAPGDGGAGLVDRLHAGRLAPQAYAACAGALGRRTLVARRYLDFLAARLDLPDDVARSLNRRFAA